MMRYQYVKFVSVSVLTLFAATACGNIQTEAGTRTNPAPPLQALSNEAVGVWLTTTDQANKLTQQPGVNFSASSASTPLTINVDETVAYQPIDGIGASLTDSTVWLLNNKVSSADQVSLFENLFDPTTGIGISLLRQPVGGSDQNGVSTPCYSYAENNGLPDPNLNSFSIAHDTAANGIISYLKKAQQINPEIKILSSVWCVPSWMKQAAGGNNNASVLSPTYYSSFASYLRKYIQAYAAQGISIWAITPQNEPDYGYANYGNNLTGAQERDLIKNDLGPTFSSNNINAKIIAYDHNWEDTAFAQTVLGDPAAAAYTAGTAWHLYAGDVSAQTSIHNLYPDKAIYFTEASGGTNNNSDWPGYMPFHAETYINIFRNWSQTFLQWTIASSTNYGPGSCTNCGPVVYVDQTTGALTYSLDYYLLGHFSKFVRPGAHRIESTDLATNAVYDVAFKNPDGSKVLVVYNNAASAQTVRIKWGGQAFSYTLPAEGIASFRWTGTQSTSLSFAASDGFSSTQGLNNWSYQYTANDDSFSDMTYDASNSRWVGTKTYCLVGSAYQHPDAGCDAARVFTAPS